MGRPDFRKPCAGCGELSNYVYCDKCAATQKCPHGNLINDGCPQCDIDGDLAYDAAREGR